MDFLGLSEWYCLWARVQMLVLSIYLLWAQEGPNNASLLVFSVFVFLSTTQVVKMEIDDIYPLGSHSLKWRSYPCRKKLLVNTFIKKQILNLCPQLCFNHKQQQCYLRLKLQMKSDSLVGVVLWEYLLLVLYLVGCRRNGFCIITCS